MQPVQHEARLAQGCMEFATETPVHVDTLTITSSVCNGHENTTSRLSERPSFQIGSNRSAPAAPFASAGCRSLRHDGVEGRSNEDDPDYKENPRCHILALLDDGIVASSCVSPCRIEHLDADNTRGHEHHK